MHTTPINYGQASRRDIENVATGRRSFHHRLSTLRRIELECAVLDSLRYAQFWISELKAIGATYYKAMEDSAFRLEHAGGNVWQWQHTLLQEPNYTFWSRLVLTEEDSPLYPESLSSPCVLGYWEGDGEGITSAYAREFHSVREALRWINSDAFVIPQKNEDTDKLLGWEEQPR